MKRRRRNRWLTVVCALGLICLAAAGVRRWWFPSAPAHSRVTLPDVKLKAVSESEGSTPEVLPPGGDVGGPHPLEPVLEMARENRLELRQAVRDYRATLVVRERINGQLRGPARMAHAKHASRGNVRGPRPMTQLFGP